MTKKEIDETLCLKLIDIYDDDRFVLGVLTFAKSEDARMKVLDFIDRGDNVNKDTVIKYAVKLSQIERNLIPAD